LSETKKRKQSINHIIIKRQFNHQHTWLVTHRYPCHTSNIPTDISADSARLKQ
jgi:hypothetical protein